MYLGRSSGLVMSSSFLISCYSLFLLSVGCSLHVFDIKVMFWYLILHFLGHFVNYIVPVFQFTSGLYLTNPLYSRNMSMLFKFVTAMSIHSIYPLISGSSGVNCITSPFLVLFTLKTLNNLFTGSVLIFFFFHQLFIYSSVGTTRINQCL